MWSDVAARLWLASEVNMDGLRTFELERMVSVLAKPACWPAAMALMKLEEGGALACCRPALQRRLLAALAPRAPGGVGARLTGAFGSKSWHVPLLVAPMSQVTSPAFAVGGVQLVLECRPCHNPIPHAITFVLRMVRPGAALPVVCQLVQHPLNGRPHVQHFQGMLCGTAGVTLGTFGVITLPDGRRVSRSKHLTVHILL